MSAKLSVKLTPSFKRKLEELEAFLLETHAINAFDDLIADLLDTVIPNLEQFPELERPFLNRPVRSLEANNGVNRLIRKFEATGKEGELREYVLSNYLLLYARQDRDIYLLSIRHHRQLSFDFQFLWPVEP